MTKAMYQMNIDTSYAINICYINEIVFFMTLVTNNCILVKKHTIYINGRQKYLFMCILRYKSQNIIYA